MKLKASPNGMPLVCKRHARSNMAPVRRSIVARRPPACAGDSRKTRGIAELPIGTGRVSGTCPRSTIRFTWARIESLWRPPQMIVSTGGKPREYLNSGRGTHEAIGSNDKLQFAIRPWRENAAGSAVEWIRIRARPRIRTVRIVAKIPFRITPMLATLVGLPFTRPNWTFEEKYDGVRMLSYKEGARVSLISRNGIDRTQRYPRV